MKKQVTINKINEILKNTIESCGASDYTGVPRGTIVNLSYADDADEIKYLIRHGIICEAGNRLVMAY